jgi:type II secretory pathway pseudopilin PulG
VSNKIGRRIYDITVTNGVTPTTRTIKSQVPMINYNKTNHRAFQSGTTLLELSVVIAVILLLVGVTFIGINAWREGANNSACVLNLSSIQKSVRGYQNMNNLNAGDLLDSGKVVGAGTLLEVKPVCPTTKTDYNYGAAVPTTGTAYATCPKPTSPHTPSAASLASW